MHRIAWPRRVAAAAFIIGLAGCDPTADHVHYSSSHPPIGVPVSGSGPVSNPTATAACTTAADCQSWETCSSTTHACTLQPGRCATDAQCDLLATCGATDHTCSGPPAADAGSDVLLFGTLERGVCGRDALSRLDTPTNVQIGTTCDYSNEVTFAMTDVGQAMIRPDGHVVYVNLSDRSEIRLFAPDSFEPDPNAPGTSLYPTHALDNDTILLANKCTLPGSSDAWGMQAGTGALMYGCRTGVTSVNGFDFYDSSDKKVLSNIRSLFAWTSGNYKLVDGVGVGFAVVSPSGASTPVTGLPFRSNSWIFRTHGDAFWVAVFPNTVPDKAELWSIDATTAVATKVGTYADPPADIVPREDQGRHTIAAVIDSAGVLYQIGDYDPNHSASAVLRRPLAPDITSVPYTEKNAPANLIDYTVFPPRNVYNRIYASQLISRP